MARERKGYVQERKDGSIWARVTYVGDGGKRRELRRCAETRTHAREIIRQLLRDIEETGHNRLKATAFDSAILQTSMKKRNSFRLSITEGERLPD
jgi:hypothetical protein